MKNLILIFCLFLCFIQSSYAQDMNLLGETKSDEVRLFWLPSKGWPEGLEGVVIKRKLTSTSNWEKLGNEPIKPSTMGTKALNNIGLNSSEAAALTAKRQEMIAGKKLKETSYENLTNYMATENGVSAMSIALSSNYDVALMAGFAYVDHVEKGYIYTYGVFGIYNRNEKNQPMGTFTPQKNPPKYDVILSGKVSKTNKSAGSIGLIWKIDTEKYKGFKVLNGFYIYRKEKGADEYVKLNDTPIWVSLKDKEGTLFYEDKGVDLEKSYIYAARASTIFNTYGEYSEVEYESSPEVPATVPAPKLDRPDKGTGSLNFKWSFPEDQQPYIKGFYVQLIKDKGPAENVSPLLEVGSRSFAYQQIAAPDNNYYDFRLIALTQDDRELWSKRVTFYNQKKVNPTVPQNLQAQFKKEGREVVLTWESPSAASGSLQYYIHSSSANEEKVWKEASFPTITATTYNYAISSSKAARYTFAISAMNEQNKESELSDKVTVLVPSESLPFINIWPIAKDENVVTLNWKYDDIVDLQGFRLYQNEQLIAELSSDTRTWKSGALDPGSYSYYIQAVSTTGVTSKESQARKFKIQ
ncbi:fibronectin type III domain-containing protein [Fulvivirga maritima]|uniref:fibronectin type III domain-containing protein n=1 Tax=Fulvivirga maritima TaxID=2904247 RepID=UPI001F1E22E2|nr:fibronectin type III domain-containing protein [Fulvivirga maritima]UII26438.1 fibronectin type III domain-containing protein [Fulvivirga maritima]